MSGWRFNLFMAIALPIGICLMMVLWPVSMMMDSWRELKEKI